MHLTSVLQNCLLIYTTCRSIRTEQQFISVEVKKYVGCVFMLKENRINAQSRELLGLEVGTSWFGDQK